MRALKTGIVVGFLLSAEGFGSQSVQPYIDQIKNKLNERDSEAEILRTRENPDPYIQGVLKESAEKKKSSKGYTEKLKRKLQAKEESPSASFTKEVQSQLPPEKGTGSAIQATLDGKSDLPLSIPEAVDQSVGFRLVTVSDRKMSIQSGPVGKTFTEIYSSDYSPELNFTYEKQLLAGSFLSLGYGAGLGIAHFRGTGQFAVSDLTNSAGEAFGTTSKTQYEFFLIPVTLGASARIKLFRYLHLIGYVGPVVNVFIENRNDAGKTRRGRSFSLQTSGGVAIGLDWISKDLRWAQYQATGMKRTYLTAQFIQYSLLSGGVDFAGNGIYAGFNFEF